MPDDGTEQRKLTAILFTDIVGSTQLKDKLGDREAVALIKRHHALIRQILGGFKEGEEIGTAGDSFLMTFSKPSDAVKFALLVQSKVPALSQEGYPVIDRIGIHVGEVLIESQGDLNKVLSGIQVDTCARVMSLAQGNQILMTRFAFDTARSVLKWEEIQGMGPLSWLNHGPYSVKGVEEPLEICEVGETGKGALLAPTSTEKAHRHVSVDEEPVLGWRPALEQVVPGTQWMLERKLGEGGFGEVWLGRHATLKEKRVFKFCFRADRVRSLKREVTLFRVLKERVGHHPNIVGIQEVFFNEPPFYIVMDYAEGLDLRSWCEAQGGVEKIPMETRLEIVAQVADGLQAAHTAGVVHRDVKPSNILVSGRGAEDGGRRAEGGNQYGSDQKLVDPTPQSARASPSSGNRKSQIANRKLEVKLTDFGIGQVVSAECLSGLTKMGFTQTMMSPGSSSQTGTHLYMAPELLAGHAATNRSDIYSLGVVLYQLLAGNFNRPVTTDWAKAIHDPLLRSDLERCFAGHPEERFAEAGQLASNLRSLNQRRVDLAARDKAVSRRSFARRSAVAFGLMAAVFFLALFAFKQGGGGSKEAPPVKLAVLPLVNLSAGERDYFADDMTDDLIVKLGQISTLRVIGRSTVMQFKKSTNSAPEIARQLGLDAVVQGTLKRDKDRVRMAVRLFRGPSDQPLWSANFERELPEVFALQNEVTLAIASQMKLRLNSSEQARLSNAHVVNREALDLYYQARDPAEVYDDQRNKVQIGLYENVVKISKDFAPAWAALADSYINRLYNFDPKNSKLWEDKAQSALNEVFRLDPDLAMARESMGSLFWSPPRKFQHEKALDLFYQALKLNSSSGGALYWLGWVYNHTGFFDEALAEATRAAELDPLWRGPFANLACTHLFKGVCEQSKGEFEESLRLWQKFNRDGLNSFAGSHWAWTLFALGQPNEAKAKIEEYLKLSTDDDAPGELTAMTAILMAAAGDGVGAIAKIKIAEKKTEADFGETHHATYLIACAYARLSRTSEALQLLKQAADTGFPCYPLFEKDPNLDNLRSRNDPEFVAFIQEQRAAWNKRKIEWAEHLVGGKATSRK